MKKAISLCMSFLLMFNMITLVYAQDDRWFDNKDEISGYSHSFCVVGDTQILTEKYHSEFPKIYDWILDNKEQKKIEYVFGVGDICQYSTEEEWQVAKAGISKLDGNIPYSLAKGSENHDSTSMMNKYFANDTYMDDFGGFYEEGHIENAWRTFRAGNIDYLNIVLDFGPSDAVLEWAADVIEAHPYHRVIINTHCYMYNDGKLQNYTHSASPHNNEIGNGKKNNGNELWDKLFSKYENIFMILCGHYASEQIIVNQRVGVNGNTVTEMLVNPQDLEAEEGAAGMVATLYFSEDGKTMDVEYYSTVRNKYFLKSNQMTIDISEFDGAKVNYSWQGINNSDKIHYDVNSGMINSSLILQPGLTEYSGQGYSYINQKAGGKHSDDYYLTFDYNSSTSHYLMYYVREKELNEKYLIFKYNVFGNNANLLLRTRLSNKSKPVFYQLYNNEKSLLKDNVWNSCMIVLDTENLKCTGYVNGVPTHTEDISKKLLEIDASYTNLTEAGVYRFELRGYDVASSSEYITLDDFCVVSSPYEALPQDIETESDSAIYGEYIIPMTDSVNGIKSDKNTIIIYNSQSGCSRGVSSAVIGDRVSVEYSDSLYGMMYRNYTASKDIKNKFYDGSSVPSDFTSYGIKFSGDTVKTENNSIGGKSSSDYYAAITGGLSAYTGTHNTYTTRYATMSFNVYGSGLKEIYARANKQVKARLLNATTYTTYLIDEKWNNIFMVYDSLTKNCKSYINGEFVYECNLFDVTENITGVTRDGDTFTYNGTDITSLVNDSDIRISFTNNTTVYFDDFATLYTDFEPVPFDNKTVVNAENAIVKSKSVIITSGNSSAKLLLPANVTFVVNRNSEWIETDTVSVGDEIMLVTHSPYGNIYDTESYKVCSADSRQSIATQSNGMSFVQGGYPWIPDENGTVKNENGVNGINVNETGAGNDVLVVDRENVFGSKMTMKEIVVGYNSKTSYKSRYQADWDKASIEKDYSYLVLEADIAFPNEYHITGISMTTNGGTSIGNGFDFEAGLKNKINHYAWVYDISNGTYEEYLNGNPLYSAPKKAPDAFVNGEKKTVRFQVDGVTKMTDSSVGTYEGGLKAYVQNLHLYACTLPVIDKPYIPDTAVGSYYPVVNGSISDIKAVKDSLGNVGVNAYFYNDISFAQELSDSSVPSAGNCIVMEKDGLYSNYNICIKSDENAEFGIKSVKFADSDCIIDVLDMGATTPATVVLAEYDSLGNLINISYTADVETDICESTRLTLDSVKNDSSIIIYVWDSFDRLTPLCKEFVVK